ncbi:amidohydrolase family protein [Paenibacillus barengoltzii]|uniref:amidohydrolase family protein n=1 Tax=Paenibacillus barengoltzii TaxID=343517 RepID=UPI002DBB1B2B|nr:amidohydrolase family protein [Paenibacillus barengoltzii]MEC2344952.1 amidohydrolase family protein [Paenibacillus barengoltzii]
MRIDAHQHFWKIDRGDYGWITPELPILYRDFLPIDLEPSLHKHQIDKTILVQAAPTVEETEFILQLSETADFIAGVVGWLDLEAPSYREQYERFAQHPKCIGFRVMIQDMEDPNTILSPAYIEALSYFADQDVPIDLLVLSHQLPQLVQLLERVPHLRGVVDHLAKPLIASGEIEPWRSQMAEIAKHTNIYCKLSGMVTEANREFWKKEDFTAYVNEVLDLFGPERIMFGSDWPVCLLAATYDEVVDLFRYTVRDRLTPEETEAVFGGNAAKFYKLLSMGG